MFLTRIPKFGPLVDVMLLNSVDDLEDEMIHLIYLVRIKRKIRIPILYLLMLIFSFRINSNDEDRYTSDS